MVLVFSKLLSFGAMSFAAARLGATRLAAHQLAFTLFLLASLVLDAAAGQTAQAFLPPLVVRGDAPASRRLGRRLGVFAAASAVAAGAVACALAARGAFLFTGDAAVALASRGVENAVGSRGRVVFGASIIGGARGFATRVDAAQALRGVAAPLSLAVLVHGAVAHGEGVCLASADLAFVGASYAVSGLIFPPLLWRYASASLPAVWTAFVAFQVARAGVLQWRAQTVLGRAGVIAKS